MESDTHRRRILSGVASAGLVSLTGCSLLRSDEALDIRVKNDTSLDHDAQLNILAKTKPFRKKTSVPSGEETTFEDAIPYPEHPEAVEYSVHVDGMGLHKEGAFALSDELARFGFRIVESDLGEESMSILTVKSYHD
ncbi:hypothetical protein BRC81_13285 [Halobacteriales archaeon QS_1_68_20]|nr:MAG: hypothetical protein BRC81_13285 [Halobacteriales archaeon QS_1_68_20]